MNGSLDNANRPHLCYASRAALIATGLWVALFPTDAAASQRAVAVLDVEADGVSLSGAETQRLTTLLSTKVAARGVQVLPRDRLLAAIRRLKVAALSPAFLPIAQLELGREIPAQVAIASHLLRLGGRCVATLTMYDLRSAATEAAADASGACGLDAVTRLMESSAEALIDRWTGRRRAPSPALFSAGSGSPDTGIRHGTSGMLLKRDARGQTSELPIMHTKVDAQVIGVMSHVTLTQQFRNPFRTPIEATYAFPLPQAAAVHAMELQVGARRIRAVIKRRSEARAGYEQAKRDGKTASLLEQERPNLFTQSVANIGPGETIAVTLKYAEELLPEDGAYAFVFPMVVGPRYVNSDVHDAAKVIHPTLPAGTRPGNDIELTLRLQTQEPLTLLRPLTHRTTINRTSPGEVTVTLNTDDQLPNRDFVTVFRLAGPRPQAQVLAAYGERGGHLLLTIQPAIHTDAQDLAPKEYLFVVDVSGSMEGVPMERARALMDALIQRMRPADRFQLIRFASGAERLSVCGLPATDDNRNRARRFVETFGAGGTESLPALGMAIGSPPDPARARVVVFLSDGFVGYEDEVLRVVQARRGRATVFAIGIGSSVNRFLIDGMAQAGAGAAFVLLNEVALETVADPFIRLVSRPALANLSIDFGKLPVVDITPQQIPDVFAQRAVTVAARYQHAAHGAAILRGYLGGRAFEQRIAVNLPEKEAGPGDETLALLWARRRMGELMFRYSIAPDEEETIAGKVTQLGLDYRLMSKFTSFVGVDEQPRFTGQRAPHVTVPQALPQGMSNSNATTTSGGLSVDQFTPGDPEVRVRAPAETKRVTLIFPDGEIKACVQDPGSGEWVASFLIADETPDGIYRIRVLITSASGEQLERSLRYQVDGVAPKVALDLAPSLVASGQRVVLEVRPLELTFYPGDVADDIGPQDFAGRVVQDVAEVQARSCSGEQIQLALGAGGVFRGELTAPPAPGQCEVLVVARDHAGNHVRRSLRFAVQAR